MDSIGSARRAPTVDVRQGDRIRVLVVDDHPAIRDAIKDTISTKMDLEVVGEAESGYEAFHIIEKQRPNVAIVDISLKDGHGLDLVQNIRIRSEEHTSELQSRGHLVCRLLLEKK